MHIFVLANVLRRPIVVYADDCLRDVDGSKIAPQNFAGVRRHTRTRMCVSRTHTRARAAGRAQIYLPLLWRAAECCAWPLALSFHHGHFCALALLHRQSKLDGARNSVCSSHARQACARACARGMATPSWVLPNST